MARSYANIYTAIWRNQEFRALEDADQKLYLLLVTQPDITAAGTLPLTVRRWADMAADTTPDGVRKSLANLAAGRFIGMDETTEELLIRTFIRHDGGFSNRKRRPVIFKAAEALASEALRTMLRGEFEHVGLPTDALPGGVSDRASDSPSQGASRGGSSVQTSTSDPVEPVSAFPQVDRLSDSLSGRASDRTTQNEGVVGCSSSLLFVGTSVSSARGAATEEDAEEDEAKRASRLPKSWAPNQAHKERATSLGLDVDEQAELFRLHAEEHSRKAKQWNSAFTRWLINAPRFNRTGPARPQPIADRTAAEEWLRGEWKASRVQQIQDRTGLRFQAPDLPLEVSGREAVAQFHQQARRDWIENNTTTIVNRLIARHAS